MAAHVAQCLAFPRFQMDHGPGIQGAVILSGLFDPNPPLRAYFGDDATLDPEDFARQAHQMARAMQAADKEPAVYQLKGHSHTSKIYSINTPDDAFAKLLVGFVVAVTGQPLMKPQQAMRRWCLGGLG